MNLTLEIPDAEVASLAAGASAASLRQRVGTELALALYAQAMLPVGKAMALCGLTWREFHELLRARGVMQPFDEAELQQELSW